MIAVSNKINHFTVINDKGPVKGQYYLNQDGDVVTVEKGTMVKPELLPYVVSVNVDACDDICTMHISEIEQMRDKLKNNMKNITNHDLQMKYIGYLEALDYIIQHNSYIDPWEDFIHNIEGDVYEQIHEFL